MTLAIGVIGLGGVSKYFVEAISAIPGCTLVAACDTDENRRASLAERDVAVHAKPDDLLADSRVEAVVLCTPVATHVELSGAAIAAGKHVCCEKPLALSRSDASSLLELASSRGLTLFTAFHRRYNKRLPLPASVSLDGLVSVESRYYERIDEHSEGADWYSLPASAGGGCIVDNGPNAYDVVRHLFGNVSVEAGEVVRSPDGADMKAVVHGRVGTTEVVIRLDWGFDGERKDVRARWRDGSELYVDMLEGFVEFKSSLAHEYVGVLEDFATHVATRRQDLLGLAATGWLEDTLAIVREAG